MGRRLNIVIVSRRSLTARPKSFGSCSACSQVHTQRRLDLRWELVGLPLPARQRWAAVLGTTQSSRWAVARHARDLGPRLMLASSQLPSLPGMGGWPTGWAGRSREGGGIPRLGPGRVLIDGSDNTCATAAQPCSDPLRAQCGLEYGTLLCTKAARAGRLHGCAAGCLQRVARNTMCDMAGRAAAIARGVKLRMTPSNSVSHNGLPGLVGFVDLCSCSGAVSFSPCGGAG